MWLSRQLKVVRQARPRKQPPRSTIDWKPAKPSGITCHDIYAHFGNRIAWLEEGMLRKDVQVYCASSQLRDMRDAP